MARCGGIAVLLCAAVALPLGAQAPGFDNSNNHALNGTYYFRQVLHAIATGPDQQGVTGDTTESIAVYGNITFDGNGNYTIAGGTAGGLVADSDVGQPTPLSCYLANTTCTSGSAVAGTYSVSQTGYAFLSNPLGPFLSAIETQNGITPAGDLVYGMVSANGIFSGSSSEAGLTFGDMFIAAPLSSPQPTAATFKGNYTVAGYLPPTGANSSSPADAADVFFTLNADGAGNLGNLNISGYFGGGSTTPITQTTTNTKYIFSNGAAVVTFPADSSASLLYGPEYFYFSPDGSFFFGGSPNSGYDMIVGVRNTGAVSNFAGLYYEAGFDSSVASFNTTGFADFDAYYGSFQTTAAGNIVAHDRLNDVFNNNGIGSTYADTFPVPVTPTYTDQNASVQYAVGAGGAVRIGAGVWPEISVTVAFQAPAFPATGTVYLNPTGIVSAASFSPFTAGVSSGEFVTLYGSNLASSPVVSSTIPYPTNLGGVQVLINGTIPAPIYYVSSGQISIIMPIEATGNFAQFQVVKDGTPSNTVTMTVNQTTPGIFTVPDFNGLGYAAAVHNKDGSLVSPSNPAVPCADKTGQTCDYIDVFLTGLGSVAPAVSDGAAAPAQGPLSYVYPPNTITAAVGGTPATVVFAGLAPGLAGLYQVNMTIPAGLASGDYTLDIGGPDSYAAQALISIGTGPTSSAVATPLSGRLRRSRHSNGKRPGLCVRNGSASCGVVPHTGRARLSDQ